MEIEVFEKIDEEKRTHIEEFVEGVGKLLILKLTIQIDLDWEIDPFNLEAVSRMKKFQFPSQQLVCNHWRIK